MTGPAAACRPSRRPRRRSAPQLAAPPALARGGGLRSKRKELFAIYVRFITGAQPSRRLSGGRQAARRQRSACRVGAGGLRGFIACSRAVLPGIFFRTRTDSTGPGKLRPLGFTRSSPAPCSWPQPSRCRARTGPATRAPLWQLARTGISRRLMTIIAGRPSLQARNFRQDRPRQFRPIDRAGCAPQGILCAPPAAMRALHQRARLRRRQSAQSVEIKDHKPVAAEAHKPLAR